MIKKFESRRFWKKLWILLDGLHWQIAFLLLLLIFIELLALIGPYILKIIIDLLTQFDAKLIKEIVGWGGLVFLVSQVNSLFYYFEDKRIFKILIETERRLSKKAFDKMISLSLNYHEKENTGNKILKIQRGISKINELMGNFFWEVAPTIFQIILTIVTLFWINWRLGMVVLFFVPMFLLITFKTNKKVYPFRIKRFDKEEEASGLMTQAVININTVKSFVQEKRELRNYNKTVGDVLANTWKEFGSIIKANIGRNLVIDAGRFFILVFGIYLVIRSNITVGSLVFAFTISEKALLSLYRISRLYDRIMQSSEAVEKLHDLFREESDIVNKKNGLKPKKIKGEIVFRNLEYIYKESGVKALSGINLVIQAGTKVALVGPSGGGKTTIARMIYRHYDPTRGEILLDGVRLKDYDLSSFRSFIAIVPQEVEIFNMTIKENIAYGRPSASMKEIKEAARTANVEEFVNKINKGYEALVGERGLKLSGGQRQRLGIARAILVNPKILIFDEATSNLDSQSERLIQDSMEKISKNRTVIVIAHRLSTIRKADNIIVLEDGKVVEQGTHDKLASVSSGLYQRLVRLQAMGELDEE